MKEKDCSLMERTKQERDAALHECATGPCRLKFFGGFLSEAMAACQHTVAYCVTKHEETCW